MHASEVTQYTHVFFENVLITCFFFFINTRGEIVLQTDRKKKVTFFFFLQLLRPNQAVKLALGTVVVGSLQLKYVHTHYTD